MPVNIRVEGIFPKRSNYPADIIPKVMSEMEAALRGPVKHRLVREFEGRAAGWEHKPAFKETGFHSGSRIMSITVGPFGNNKRIWIFVSGGVSRHPIPKSGSTRMRIRGGRGGYSSHTTATGSTGRGSSYDESATFYAYNVDHPGIKARNFEADIADKAEGYIVGVLALAFSRAVK